MRTFAGVAGFCLLSSFSFSSQAAPIHPHGAMLTNGMNAIPGSLVSVSRNPAAGEIIIKSDKRFRMGFMSSLGMSMELGDVDNFEAEVDELIDLLDQGANSYEEASAQLDRFNEILPLLGENGYLKFQGGFYVPLFPLAIRTTGLMDGVWALDADGAVQMSGSILDAPLNIDISEGSIGYQTDTAIYLKSAIESHASLGYSRALWKGSEGILNGSLLVGARINAYRMELSKQVIAIEALNGQDLGDIIQDEYDNNLMATSNMGIDVGVMWVANRFHLGAMIANINEPEFEFGEIGVGCENKATLFERSNCFAAQKMVFGTDEIAPVINGSEVHVKSALLTVDGSYRITPTWLVSFSYDMDAYNDPVGGEFQYMTVSTSHYPSMFWLPAWRLGYRANQVGSKLSSMNVGTTLFGLLNLDLSYGLDSTSVDGSEFTRSVAFNLGFEQKF